MIGLQTMQAQSVYLRFLSSDSSEAGSLRGESVIVLLPNETAQWKLFLHKQKLLAVHWKLRRRRAGESEMFSWLRRQKTDPEHEEVEQKLNKHTKELEQHARRLRRLEIEAGIFKPPLRRVGN